MKSRLLGFVAMTCIAFSCAPAPPANLVSATETESPTNTSAKQVLEDLMQSLRLIDPYRKEFVSLSDDNNKRVSNVVDNFKIVAALNEANESRPMPKDYLETLQSDIELLKRVRKVDDAKRRDSLEIIASVALDLELKAAAATDKIEGNPYWIKVIVDTKDAGKKPVDGLQVMCVPKGLADDPKRAKAFERLSTPTDRELPPGNWQLWSENPEKKDKKSGTKDVAVGLSGGKREMKVDIFCP